MRSRFPRAGGILLHPTSLPGAWGVGDLGPTAYAFVDFLAAAGQQLWQVLPLNPTGYGDSPYQSPSTFAGNPILISPELLLEDGLLERNDLYKPDGSPIITPPHHTADYVVATDLKRVLLRRAWERFQQGAGTHLRAGFDHFCAANADWLDDYCLFAAIKAHHGYGAWYAWEPDLVAAKPAAVTRMQETLAHEIDQQRLEQFLFFHQWQRLRQYAHDHGIKIIGDAPIFVADDSVDIWTNRDLFLLDRHGLPTHVAGVPPDYFSVTGQRWGNPLYDWDRMAKDDYAWWRRRLAWLFSYLDILRLDHFRGFEAYWAIPAADEDARNGRWRNGPGRHLFSALASELGDLPLIAEDLGVITPAVEQLRDEYLFPGMKVLQFAFGDTAGNPYLPHNYTNPNAVVYTATHDNDTTVGWYASREQGERTAAQQYLGSDGSNIAWAMIRLAYASVADMAIVPLQDVLELGSDARMNTPGQATDNWRWRFTADQITPTITEGLHLFSEIYGRKRDPNAKQEPAT